MLAADAEVVGVEVTEPTVHVISTPPAAATVTVVVAAVAALKVTPVLGEALH